ncbi:MAG: PaaI family thioesterase [Slackia sp.]|nr:PaaI family thioesterase [Slackia sp.]
MFDAAAMEKLRCNIPSLAEFQDNIEIVEVEKPGFVTFTMDIPASLGNYRGGIHGGTGYFIGEIGCGFATYSLGVSNVCTSASINFIKAVPCCKVEARTEVVHAGRSTAVVRVSTYEAASGRLLFQSTHNMFLFGPLEEK